jgi:uncharacterized LabA/DUF88 family protein
MVKELDNWDGNGLKKRLRKRAVIFWDHANTFHPLQERGVRIDYKRVKEVLAKDYYLLAPVMYLGKPDILRPEKKGFLKALRKIGWSIQEKPLKMDKSGIQHQAGVDELMLSDISILADEDAYEKAIIVSGDIIFCNVIMKLRNLNKTVELWAFKGTISLQLIACAETRNVHYLDNILDEITFKKS